MRVLGVRLAGVFVCRRDRTMRTNMLEQHREKVLKAFRAALNCTKKLDKGTSSISRRNEWARQEQDARKFLTKTLHEAFCDIK